LLIFREKRWGEQGFQQLTKSEFLQQKFFLVIVMVAVYGIETLQYFNVYDATFDPLDIVAYSSLLVPVFVIDLLLTDAKIKHR
jgi:hypothetical protein